MVKIMMDLYENEKYEMVLVIEILIFQLVSLVDATKLIKINLLILIILL